MNLINVLALYLAIKHTAKRYHWKSVGSQYMSDHLLFDRIADAVDEGLIDTIAEQYYMGVGRKNLNELDQLCSLAVQMEGQVYESSDENMKLMFLELSKMMNTFLINIENISKLRGINNTLDDMASSITQVYGLVIARLV